jgi:hypothetical protein
MPIYAVIENESVVNICVDDPENERPSNWILSEIAQIGWQYKNGEFIAPKPVEPPLQDLIALIRQQRDFLLQSSDWTQVADAPVDKAAWATYRQALRDIPQQEGFPVTVDWPSQPE